MSNEKRVENLSKRISTSLRYSEKIPSRKSPIPDSSKLKSLAKEIRKTVEDYSVEATTYPHPNNGSK